MELISLSYFISLFINYIQKFGIYLYKNIFTNYDYEESLLLSNWIGFIFTIIGLIYTLFGDLTQKLLGVLFLFFGIASLTIIQDLYKKDNKY